MYPREKEKSAPRYRQRCTLVTELWLVATRIYHGSITGGIPEANRRPSIFYTSFLAEYITTAALGLYVLFYGVNWGGGVTWGVISSLPLAYTHVRITLFKCVICLILDAEIVSTDIFSVIVCYIFHTLAWQYSCFIICS